MNRRNVSRRNGEHGAAAVEIALLLPMLLLLLGGVIDLGNALRVKVQLQEAVQDGASFAANNPDKPALTRQRVLEASQELTPDTITITCSGSSPVVVTVHAVHAHHWLSGMVQFPSITMTADAAADVTNTTTCVSG